MRLTRRFRQYTYHRLIPLNRFNFPNFFYKLDELLTILLHHLCHCVASNYLLQLVLTLQELTVAVVFVGFRLLTKLRMRERRKTSIVIADLQAVTR